MVTKNHEFEVRDAVVKPGHRKTLMLDMPRLYDWTPMQMPVHVVNGKFSGPVLCLTAAIHGDEINGIEIIYRLLKRIRATQLSGTLIAVPIVNSYGFLYQNRYLMDRRDLNRSFPGSQRGSLASRLADLVNRELVSRATHVIDLHTGSQHRCNLPQIRANLDNPQVTELAKAFNVPVILHSKIRDGSLRQIANDQDIPILVYEAGESLRFDELSIRNGLNGVRSVMQELGMLTLKKTKRKKIIPAIARSSFWVRAPHSGILRQTLRLGRRVQKNDVLGVIANPVNFDEEKVRSPREGIIIGKSNLPLAHEGAALFHVACFEEVDHVEEQIEYLQERAGYYPGDTV